MTPKVFKSFWALFPPSPRRRSVAAVVAAVVSAGAVVGAVGGASAARRRSRREDGGSLSLRVVALVRFKSGPAAAQSVFKQNSIEFPRCVLRCIEAPSACSF